MKIEQWPRFRVFCKRSTLGTMTLLAGLALAPAQAESPRCGGTVFTVRLVGFRPHEIKQVERSFPQMKCYDTRRSKAVGSDHEIVYETGRLSKEDLSPAGFRSPDAYIVHELRQVFSRLALKVAIQPRPKLRFRAIHQ
jgi:hypothetical protein